MGSAFDAWTNIEGPIYMGANTSWEVIWLVVSIAFCVTACIVGSRHELKSYKKADKRTLD